MIITPVALKVKEALLKKQACFTQLRKDELEILAELLIEKHYAPGEIIVNEGDPVDCFFLIVSGIAEVKKAIYENKTPTYNILATLSNGDAIGLNETGFYSLTGRRTATVVAKTELLTVYLTVPLFHGFSLAYSHVNEVMRKQSANLIFKK